MFCNSTGRLWRGFTDREVLAHFFKPLRPEPADRQQIVNALERAVRLAHLKNFFRRGRTNPGHQLQFFRRRRIDVHRLRRRLFLGERTCAERKANN